MTWAERIAEWGIPLVATAIGVVAKWVHTMASRLDQHEAQLTEMREEQERCSEQCHDTRERISLSEQDRHHIHTALVDLKEDLRKILWHVRPPKHHEEE